MESTATNSTDAKKTSRNTSRWKHLTKPGKLRRELAFMQRLIDLERADKEQALQDYDQIEEELSALLSVDSSITPNPTLLAMAHEDLAIYADQLRAKSLVLGGHSVAAASVH